MRSFFPCIFHFDDQDIRVEGQVVSSGPSLSGIEEPIATDGGGVVVADFMNGDVAEREEVLAWRAFAASLDGGAARVVVHFGDRYHQPVGDPASVPHSDDAPFSDDEEYSSGGADYEASVAAALRATTITIAGSSELPLVGGEWFSILHPNWGWRAYNIIAIDGATIEFRPPLREAVTAGTEIEFDDPRCVMRRAQPTSNALNVGRYGAPSISFVEDMRKPA
ncbi:hypothetical protein SAMN06295920_103175 [Rhizorhabdus histidinilytica]|uniref:Uncharacterized protein n=1 Tax=Rhizorhabdus histidinilytica TaxID=439228 RepID=A0A1T5BQ95_9SPHN|nr:hypothetical protein SAMN06295920_103175 [Rhizorhabdus histidinilytica]